MCTDDGYRAGEERGVKKRSFPQNETGEVTAKMRETSATDLRRADLPAATAAFTALTAAALDVDGRLLRLDAGCGIVYLNLSAFDDRAVQMFSRPIRVRSARERHEAESFRSSLIEDDLHIKDRTKLLLLSFTMQKTGRRLARGRKRAKLNMREAFRRGDSGRRFGRERLRIGSSVMPATPCRTSVMRQDIPQTTALSQDPGIEKVYC